MLNVENLPQALALLGFSRNGHRHTATFGSALLVVDTEKQHIHYPEDAGLKVNERQTCNFSQAENFVVLECVHRLLTKGYKPEHIELEPKWKLGHGASGGRADILVRDNHGKALLLIECKTPGREYDRAWNAMQQDGGQLLSYAQQEPATQFLCLYTSAFVEGAVRYQSRIVAHRDNPKYLEERPEYKGFKDASDVRERFAVWRDTYKLDHTTQGLFEANIQPYHIGKDKYGLADLKTVSAEDQQKQYHRFATILRQHNVSGRENAFDKLVNLFLCKLVDETQNPNDLQFYWKGVAYDTHFDLLDRVQKLYRDGMKEFLGEEITYIDQAAVRGAMRYIRQNPDATQKAVWNLFLQQKFFTNNDFSLIDVHNERLFYQNAEVLLKILQMWQDVRLTGEQGNSQFLGDLFEGFLDQGIKQSEGQFFTPMPICRFILMSLPLPQMAELGVIKGVDYACGAGHFLTELAQQLKPLLPPEKLQAQHAALYGIEKEYRLSKVAKVSAFMYGQKDIHICYGDALVSQHPAFKEIQDGSFDLLVANPPYSVKGFLETLPEAERARYSLTKTISDTDKSGSIECFFVERAAQLLKGGGVAAIVLPASILSNGGGTYVRTREVLLESFEITAIAELGSGTFGKTGTNTVTLFLRRKPHPPEAGQHWRERVAQWFATDEDQPVYEDAGVIARYAAHIGVTEADYQSLLRGDAHGGWSKAAHFEPYTQAFNASTEVANLYKAKWFKALDEATQTAEVDRRYLAYVTAIERDKLLYFALANEQASPVLLIKSPSDNKAQKAFLGYEWSSAKGDEGIKLIKDARGQHLTALYDPLQRHNPDKLAHCIASNFLGAGVVVPEGLKEVASTARLVDLLDFSRVGFEKVVAQVSQAALKPSTQWPVKLMREVAVLNPSKTELRGLDPSTIISFVDMASISEAGFISSAQEKKYGEIKGGSYTYFADGDILIAKITPCMENGKCALAADLKSGIGLGSTEFHVIRADKARVLPAYLFTFLNRPMLRSIAAEKMTGSSGHRRVPESFYSELALPLPPLAIQQQIVTECEAVDAEVRAAQARIAEAQAAITQAVEAIYASRAPRKQLQQIANLSRGASPRPISDFTTESADGVPWIKIGDVAPGDKYIRQTAERITAAGAGKSRRVKPGDFIVSNSMSVGRPYILAIEGCVHDGWLILSEISGEIDRDYLYNVLSGGDAQAQFTQRALGGVVQNLNIDRAKTVTIPVPPLAIQQATVALITRHEQAIASARAVVAAAAGRKQAILERHS